MIDEKFSVLTRYFLDSAPNDPYLLIEIVEYAAVHEIPLPVEVVNVVKKMILNPAGKRELQKVKTHALGVDVIFDVQSLKACCGYPISLEPNKETAFTLVAKLMNKSASRVADLYYQQYKEHGDGFVDIYMGMPTHIREEKCQGTLRKYNVLYKPDVIEDMDEYIEKYRDFY